MKEELEIPIPILIQLNPPYQQAHIAHATGPLQCDPYKQPLNRKRAFYPSYPCLISNQRQRRLWCKRLPSMKRTRPHAQLRLDTTSPQP